MQIRSSAQYLCRQIDAHSGSHSQLESLVLRHVAGDFFALGESSPDNLPNEPDDKDDEQTKNDSDPDPA
ncbi:MAG: hypothetical protein IPI27_20455 [Betaproteobacteria bacterium]|nr:hypothetical protein [Betaproteobacteria bacterium]